MPYLVCFLRKHVSSCCRSVSSHPYQGSAFNRSQLIQSVLRKFISLIDRSLRARLRIFEFTQDQRCILRASLTYAKYSVRLSVEEQIDRGDQVLELHFWNERLISVLDGRSLLGRGVRLRRSLHESLVQLASYVVQHEDMQHARAIYARLARDASKFSSDTVPLGFKVISARRSLADRGHDMLEHVLIHALCWAFRPMDHRPQSLSLKRIELWLPVKDFLDLYHIGDASRSLLMPSWRVSPITLGNNADAVSLVNIRTGLDLHGTNCDLLRSKGTLLAHEANNSHCQD